MTAVDFLASRRHYVDHLAPIYLALPAELRGTFYAPGLMGHAIDRGVIAAGDLRAGSGNAPIVTAAYDDLKAARKYGRTRHAFAEHGIGQSYGGRPGSNVEPSYPGGGDRRDVTLFLVPNGSAAIRWNRAYPSARVEVVGSPRLDSLPPRGPRAEGPVVAVSFHWNCRVCAETRTAFFEYRGGVLALTREFKVLGHGHPRLFDSVNADLRAFYRKVGVEIVEDFDDVIRRADVYVCDNSSTMYEAAAAGIPVVVLNSERYDRGITHGLRFWEAARVGVPVNSQRELPDAVRQALADPPAVAAAREVALNIVYAHRSGAAARAAEAIASWAGARMIGPAGTT